MLGKTGLSRHIALDHGRQRSRRRSGVRPLSNGGQVLMPIGKTFFSPRFGMLADRFGVPWMVYVQPTA